MFWTCGKKSKNEKNQGEPMPNFFSVGPPKRVLIHFNTATIDAPFTIENYLEIFLEIFLLKSV